MTSRPNILLILTDQQRYDSLGCYGTAGVHTPNLDRLAAEGVLFERCYVNNTICTPARASLWTGKHLPGHGVYRLHDCLPEDEVLFPYRLREAGYDTALFGKLHVSGHVHETAHRHPHDGFRVYEWTPDPHGFLGCDTAYRDWLAEHHPDVLDRFDTHRRQPGHLPIEAHMTTWAADRTIDFIATGRDTSKPFFCCMSVFDPHDPYSNYPIEMRDLIDKAALPDIHAAEEPFDRRPVAHGHERKVCYLGPPEKFSPDDIREWRVGYHAAVALIDMQVGRVLAMLEEQGLAGNTVVIFTSDHGDMLGDHNLLVKGCYFYDPCTRVPMLVRVPGGPNGVRVDAPCQLHDVAATCLLAAGCDRDKVGEWMPDAVALSDADALAARGYAACMYRNTGIAVDRAAGLKGYNDPPLHATMWLEWPYKLNVYHSPPETGDHPPVELFDMEKDPLEMTNLWHDAAHRDTRDRLLLRLTNWLAEQDFKGRGIGKDGMPTDASYHRTGRIK